MSKTSIAPVVLALSSDGQPEISDADARIRAIANPPAACPACWAEQYGRPLPGNYTTAICPIHAAAMWAVSESRKSHAGVRA